MDEYINSLYPVGSLISEIEVELHKIGWTLEEWKQVQRNKRK